MVHFSCPSCNARLNAKANFAGRKIRCPSCGQKILVPAPPAPQNRTVLGRLDATPAASFAPAPMPQYAPPSYGDDAEAAAFRRRRARQGYLVVTAVVVPLVVAVVAVWSSRPEARRGAEQPITPRPVLSKKQRELTAAAIKQLGKLEAALEVGVAYQPFAQMAIEAKAVVNESLAALMAGELGLELKSAMEAYADSVLVWHHKIRYPNVGLRSEFGHGELIARYGLPTDENGQANFDVALQLIWAAAKKHLTAARALTS